MLDFIHQILPLRTQLDFIAILENEQQAGGTRAKRVWSKHVCSKIEILWLGGLLGAMLIETRAG